MQTEGKMQIWDNDPEYKSWDVMETMMETIASFLTYVNMRCSVMFITAVCVLFLFKLKWPEVEETDTHLACDQSRVWNAGPGAFFLQLRG